MRAFLRFGVCASILLAPLPFGGVTPKSVLALEVWAAVLGVLAVAVLLRDRRPLPPTGKRVAFVAAFLVLVGALQFSPAPQRLVAAIAEPTAQAAAALANVRPQVLPTISASPVDTFGATLLLCSYLLFGIAAVTAFHDRSHLGQLGTAIACSGLFQALYGASQYLSGHQHIFGFAKLYYLDSATGTFINRNHFATFLAMSAPFLLVRWLAVPAGINRSLRLKWLGRLPPELGRSLPAFGANLILWIGILLSYSRAGMIAALAASLFLFPRIVGRRSYSFAVIASLTVAAALLMSLQVTAPGARLAQVPADLSFAADRPVVWTATLRAVPSYLLLGSGWGTFSVIFGSLQPPGIDHHYEHAHNEWLQVLLEGGIGSLFAVIIVLLLLIQNRPRLGHAPQSSYYWAALAAILAVSLDSLVDFPLRIPAIAMLTTVCIAIGSIAESGAAEPSSRNVSWVHSDRGE